MVPSIDRRTLLGGAIASTAISGLDGAASAGPGGTLYHELLARWIGGLVACQATGMRRAGENGGFLCPACALVHGRSGDAVYPLLAQARLSGDDRLVAAARAAHDWCEAHTSRPDGSWVNDPALSTWKGITVFRAIALAETLHRHGDLLDRTTRERWRTRLTRAVAFLDGFITFEVGNINYPVSMAYAAALSARVLGSSALEARGRAFAHGALDYLTANGLLFGEGHPQRGLTPKGCRPVDLGYNVEESLPALARYARLTGDTTIEDAVAKSLAAHLDFMLPDGAWDNSWGSRNYKWSWWGSRTSDGCQTAFALLAGRDPRFAEAAHRNLALMARATAEDGLLAGGLDYGRAGYRACLHHSLSHASALAAVIDSGAAGPATPADLPCDRPQGLRSWPEIDTHRVATDDWRATVTGYDFDYLAPAGGSHATGGALSLLYHRKLGPLIAAGMNNYQVVENGNQQLPRDASHRPNSARIEMPGSPALVSTADGAARVTAKTTDNGILVEANGVLRPAMATTAAAAAPSFHLSYAFIADRVTITARIAPGVVKDAQLILPIICRPEDRIVAEPGGLRVAKPGGALVLASKAAFTVDPGQRSFNLVPGFLFAEIALAFAGSDTIEVVLTCP